MEYANLLEAALIGGAIYGGIRADIKAMHQRIANTEKSNEQAHKRIDNLLSK